MKKNAYLFILMVLLFGCGSKPVPEWTYTAFNQLESYKKNYLMGKENIAELHFNKATEEIKKSGDLEILARAYLTKCAVQSAVLEMIDDREYLKIDALHPSPQNRSFHNFLKGKLDLVEGKLLPEQYQSLFAAYRIGSVSDLTRVISGMEDPLSKLIAAGLIVRHDKCGEECLKEAIDTASKEGWKKALLVYLEKLQSLYEAGKDTEKMTNIRKKIELIRN